MERTFRARCLRAGCGSCKISRIANENPQSRASRLQLIRGQSAHTQRLIIDATALGCKVLTGARKAVAPRCCGKGRQMKIVIAGSSGLIGGALARRLRDEGDDVTRLVRRAPAGGDEARWDPDAGELDGGVFAGADAVVHLGGRQHRGQALERGAQGGDTRQPREQRKAAQRNACGLGRAARRIRVRLRLSATTAAAPTRS